MASSEPGFFGSIWRGFLRGIGFGLALTIVPTVMILALAFFLMDDDIEEDPYQDEVKTEHAVAVVDLKGEIFDAERFRKELEQALESDLIKAVVVRINSPGGGVAASEEMFSLIRDAKQKKPVVCSLGSIAASGGLYASLGCDKVVTYAGTLTGSIGVIVMMPEVHKIVENLGAGMNVIKSGRFKDVGSPFRAMSDDDRTLVQKLVNDTYEQFIKAVSTNRSIPLEDVRKFADGRIILGEDAVKLGLAHEIGDVKRAAILALQLKNDRSEPELIYPLKPTGLERLFGPEEWSFIRFFKTQTEFQVLYKAFL